MCPEAVSKGRWWGICPLQSYASGSLDTAPGRQPASSASRSDPPAALRAAMRAGAGWCGQVGHSLLSVGYSISLRVENWGMSTPTALLTLPPCPQRIRPFESGPFPQNGGQDGPRDWAVCSLQALRKRGRMEGRKTGLGVPSSSFHSSILPFIHRR